MLIAEYATHLTMLVDPAYAGKYLAPRSKEIILERIYSLEKNTEKAGKKGKKGKRKLKSWEFSISRDEPLVFRENSEKYQVDIAGIICGVGDDITEVKTRLRVWSLDEALCYRDGIDCAEFKNKFQEYKKRVMVRYHFDRRAPSVEKPEPIYHLQVGGQTLPDENCWFPKQIEVPRFHFPPMDIILLCELVLVNFFHKESEILRKKPEWIRLIQKSQHIFQDVYFTQFNKCCVNSSNTILGHLLSLTPPGRFPSDNW